MLFRGVFEAVEAADSWQLVADREEGGTRKEGVKGARKLGAKGYRKAFTIDEVRDHRLNNTKG